MISEDFYISTDRTTCLVPIPLPGDEDFPLNYTRIGYHTVLTEPDVIISATPNNSQAVLTTTLGTWERYTADSGAVTLEYSWNPSKPASYVGIGAHNLSVRGALVTVSVAYSPGVYTPVYSQIPENDNAIMPLFDLDDIFGVLIEVAAGNDEPIYIGNVYAGIVLEMMRPTYGGHNPAVLNANDVFTNQLSDGGQFLGRQFVRRGYMTQYNFKHLRYEWYEQYFQPFVVHAKTRPYFVHWNALEHPDDAVFGWTSENFEPTLMAIRNWLEITWSIKIHS